MDRNESRLRGVLRLDGGTLSTGDVLPGQIAPQNSAAPDRAFSVVVQGGVRAVVAADGLCVAGEAHLVKSEAGAARDALDQIADAYRRGGVEALETLDGQFCFALRDPTRGRLILATDRFSTRPIYYAERSGHLSFGTGVGDVADPAPSIDPRAVQEYLLYHNVPAPRSIYLGICKLPPAHLLVADRSGLKLSRYWDMSYPEETHGSTDDWARETRRALESAVERSLVAEPNPAGVGAFLSGGTDSSTVAGLLSGALGRPVPTFSIGYDQSEYDELRYARLSAQRFRTQLHETRLSAEQAFDSIPAIVSYYEEPFGNSSVLPTYACARMAADAGIEVLFAGDGGDEVFAGNERYSTDQVFAYYQCLPRQLRRSICEPLLAAVPDAMPLFGKARRYVARANIPNPRRLFSYNLFVAERLDQILTGDFLAAIDPSNALATAEAHFGRPREGTSELNRMMYLDLQLTIAANDIRKVSGMTDLAGVRVRYPLLDTQLVEFTGRLPTGQKMRGRKMRYIFKRALADFLPPEVLTKTKHGFGTPIAYWMKTNPAWRGFVGDLLHDPRTRQRGYISPSFLDRLWQQVVNDEAVFYGDTLWPLLMLELWHRQHVDARRQRPDLAVGAA